VQYLLNATGEANVGFTAEALFEVFPLAVNLDKDDKPDSVKYGQITALLLMGAKHQDRVITDMKKQLKHAEEDRSKAASTFS